MSPRVPSAAVLTGAAGLVHMAAAVTHVGETVLLGLMFAFVGWAQMLTALLLSAGRGRGALTVMSVTNLAALAGWVLSRTAGLPFLHPGVEAAGTADVLTAVLEVLALAAAVTHVRGRRSPGRARRTLPLGLVAASLFALAGSGVAVAALGSEGGHGHGEEVTADGGEGHGHGEGETGGGRASAESRGNVGGQPGTLPARLHHHRPGIYHLHEDIALHQHDRGIVHVHTKADGASSPDGAQTGGADGGEHHEDGGDGHTH